ncbi:hypothetical protein [Altererythrobacter lutimaris]|uniref:Uncharacterized protein n=1 Tax=Altererythrobacter lutimaris TaxID=2743979 RepID=A0A850HBM2_9SPHN|nr:hypothetical protein [Altererythrobacter lutimaris]NVE95159.1 hypothetical protein [Altererythrobacter lutimaris]
MFEILAHGGEYIAITALCFSCWAAGRSVRTTSPAYTASAHVENRNESSPLAFSPRRSPASTNSPSMAVTPLSIDEIEEAPLQAERLQELIRTGDLSDEGVIQSLVALAEESDDQPEQTDAWRFSSSTNGRHRRCSEARILTRHGRTTEPLPANLIDPLTPEVLSRYRMYAQECSPRV